MRERRRSRDAVRRPALSVDPRSTNTSTHCRRDTGAPSAKEIPPQTESTLFANCQLRRNERRLRTSNRHGCGSSRLEQGLLSERLGQLILRMDVALTHRPSDLQRLSRSTLQARQVFAASNVDQGSRDEARQRVGHGRQAVARRRAGSRLGFDRGFQRLQGASAQPGAAELAIAGQPVVRRHCPARVDPAPRRSGDRQDDPRTRPRPSSSARWLAGARA